MLLSSSPYLGELTKCRCGSDERGDGHHEPCDSSGANPVIRTSSQLQKRIREESRSNTRDRYRDQKRRAAPDQLPTRILDRCHDTRELRSREPEKQGGTCHCEQQDRVSDPDAVDCISHGCALDLAAQRPSAQRLRPAAESVTPRIPASGSKSAAAESWAAVQMKISDAASKRARASNVEARTPPTTARHTDPAIRRLPSDTTSAMNPTISADATLTAPGTMKANFK